MFINTKKEREKEREKKTIQSKTNLIQINCNELVLKKKKKNIFVIEFDDIELWKKKKLEEENYCGNNLECLQWDVFVFKVNLLVSECVWEKEIKLREIFNSQTLIKMQRKQNELKI